MKKTILLLVLLLNTLAQGQFWENPNQKPSLFGMRPNRGHILGKPIGLWLMSEGFASKVYDLSGNGYDGPLGGNTAWTTGLFGPCIDLPGDAGDSIEPGVILFDCSKPFAVSCWINPDTSGAQDAIWSKYDGGTFGVILRRNSDTTLNVWLSNATTQLNTVVNNGIWYHVVITYNGTDTYIYVNGVLDSAFPVTRTLTDLSRLFQIGESSLGHYDGQMDNLLVWDRFFSASEVALLYREPFCMLEPLWNLNLYFGISVPTGAPQVIFIN